jgi:WD40 repeat protein
MNGKPTLDASPTELKGHTDLVYGLTFNPEGNLLATAGFDNLVKLWEFPAGKELRSLAGHTGPVYSVAFSPDGKTLASSSHDQTIRLWNVADGKFLRELKGHTGIVDSVAFNHDGTLVASGSGDKSVRLWNPADGKEVKNLGSHANSVFGVAFSPDGKTLASAGADGLIKLWEIAGQKELKTLKGHDGPVTGVVFSPDSASVYSIGLIDRTLRQWNVAMGTELKKLGPTPDDPYGIAWSRDGKMLATSGYGGNIIVWNLAEGKPANTIRLKFGAFCVAFTPDGKAVVTGHADKMCYVTPIKSP